MLPLPLVLLVSLVVLVNVEQSSGADPNAPAANPSAQSKLSSEEASAIWTVKALGGWVTHENSEDQSHVIEVEILDNDAPIQPELLAVLADFPKLKALDVSGPVFNDRNLRYLQDLKGLEKLSLYARVTDDGTRYLEGLKNLRQLSLGGPNITDVSLQHLTSLKELEEIDLAGTKVGDKAFDALSKLPNLRVLNLGATYITSEGFKRARDCKSLKYLDLHGTRIGDWALRDLLRCPSLETIEATDTLLTREAVARARKERPELKITAEPRPVDTAQLSKLPFQEAEAIRTLQGLGIHWDTQESNGQAHVVEIEIFRERDSFCPEYLAALASFPKLKAVNLDGSEFRDCHLQYLQDLTQLEELSIRGEIRDDGLRDFRRLKNLRDLSLRLCVKITDKGLRHLTKLEKLEQIDLSDTKVGDDAFASLCQLPNLKTAILDTVNITSYGFERVKDCPKLESIVLCRANVRDRALRDLLRCKSLKRIAATDTALSNDAVERAMSEHPGLMITSGRSNSPFP